MGFKTPNASLMLFVPAFINFVKVVVTDFLNSQLTSVETQLRIKRSKSIS